MFDCHISESELNAAWIVVPKTQYCEQQLLDVETIVKKIILNHQRIFGGAQSVYGRLADLHITSKYFERICDDYFTFDTEEMASLALPKWWMHGSDKYVREQGVMYALSSGNMKATGFCTRVHQHGIGIHWEAVSGLEASVDFQIMMTIRFGQDTDGFATADDLLIALRQWIAMAEIVSESCEEIETIRTRITSHYSPFRQVCFHKQGWPTYTDFVATALTFPEIQYKVVPMWSRDSSFRSASELCQYLLLDKPDCRPTATIDYQPFFASLPRGVGDYVVDYDSIHFQWALLFSPRLCLFYNITVTLNGIYAEEGNDLKAAYSVLCNPHRDPLKEGSVGLPEVNHNSLSEPTCSGLDDEPTLESFC